MQTSSSGASSPPLSPTASTSCHPMAASSKQEGRVQLMWNGPKWPATSTRAAGSRCRPSCAPRRRCPGARAERRGVELGALSRSRPQARSPQARASSRGACVLSDDLAAPPRLAGVGVYGKVILPKCRYFYCQTQVGRHRLRLPLGGCHRGGSALERHTKFRRPRRTPRRPRSSRRA